MDATVIALISTLVVSIIGNVAAWWQLANQAKKDKLQANIDVERLALDKNKAETEKEAADLTASLSVIETLRAESERLQKRGIELENLLIARTTEIGELKLAAIDKEAELRTIRYKMENLQMRYDSIIGAEKEPVRIDNKLSRWREELVVGAGGLDDAGPDSSVEEAFVEETDSGLEFLMSVDDENKKALISQNINTEIEELKSNSISKLKTQ